MTNPSPLQIGMLLFPGVTQLDLTGPFELFSRIPGARLATVWKQPGPVRADSGLELVASEAYATCPPLDLRSCPAATARSRRWRTPRRWRSCATTARGRGG